MAVLIDLRLQSLWRKTDKLYVQGFEVSGDQLREARENLLKDANTAFGNEEVFQRVRQHGFRNRHGAHITMFEVGLRHRPTQAALDVFKWKQEVKVSDPARQIQGPLLDVYVNYSAEQQSAWMPNWRVA